MPRLFALFVAVCSLLSPTSRAQAQGGEWTWVLAESLENEENVELATFARRMYDHYQERSLHLGALTSESALTSIPEGPTVFLGPAGGFKHPEWLASLLGVDGAGVRLGGRTFVEPETGIYVRSADGKRLALTGTTGVGFRQIFSVRTGGKAATVTIQGRVALEGEYRFGALALRGPGFPPALPSQKALELALSGMEDAASAIDLSPVHASPGSSVLAEPFQKRLGALVKVPRVLFIGESHWNAGINRLFTDTLGWLMRERSVSTLFLEASYSHSAHFDHYVTIASDERAERFWWESLRSLVISASTRDLLESVRVWNRAHPESRVVVACVDAEFDFRRTLEDVLAEYFIAFDPDFEVNLPVQRSASMVLNEAARMRGILEHRAPGVPTHPWMSLDFVLNTLTNLEEAVRVQGGQEQLSERQRSIVRNITEFHADRFVVSELDRGLVVFKMGGAHADRSAVRDDGNWWEAPYLEQRYEPTRGQVATMLFDSIGYGFDEVGRVDKRTHKTWARSYHQFVDDYRKALRAGEVHPGQLFTLGGGQLPGVEMVVLQHAYASGEHALLLNVASEFGLVAAGLPPSNRPWERFDEVVFVVGGQMEAPLLKSAGH